MRQFRTVPNKKPRKNPEHELQCACIRVLKFKYPKALYCASAGGLHTSKAQAIKMKSAGYVAGFPDLFIYEPRGEYHGLSIELKDGSKGMVSSNQLAWKEKLTERGYKAEIVRNLDEFINVLETYLG